MKAEKKLKTDFVIDLYTLRQKGFSYSKISKMIGIPVEKVKKRIRIEKMHNRISGVF